MSFCSFLIYNFHNIQEETAFWDTGVLLKWGNQGLTEAKKKNKNTQQKTKPEKCMRWFSQLKISTFPPPL